LTDTVFAANCNNNNGSATVTATGGTPGYLYQWSPNGGNAATAINLAAGNYTCAVTDSKGCQKSIVVNVPLIPSTLSPNFSSTIACPGSPTQFTDLSSVSNDTIIAWSWDFGDPSTGTNNASANQNPTHNFSASGSFTVTLIVATMSGCTTSVALPVSVYPTPATGFTVSSNCVNNSALFTNTSTISGGTITSYTWNFGDSGSGLSNASNQTNPSHTYYTSGVYTITLSATSNNGCISSSTQTLSISPSPLVSFTATAVCQNQSTQFIDSTHVLSGNTISGWVWNFGDGSPFDSTQNPAHTYTTGGYFNVVLTVTSSNGCKGSDTLKVLVNPLPNVNFSAPHVCLNNATPFTNQTTISPGSISSYSWDFGNFSPLNHSQNPNYLYGMSGTFSVTLTAISAAGCTSSVAKPVTVYPLPSALFSASNTCADSTTHFTDLSTISGGNSINGWQWAFGDGSPTSTVQNPTHIYSQPGTYNVAMIVKSDWGCVDTILKSVTVYPSPSVQFDVTDSVSCLNSCTHFTDLSSVSPGNIVAWNWDFGDSTITNTSQNPMHCYNHTGIYSITLTVTSALGCSYSYTHQNYIHVFPVPHAEFSYSPSPPISIVDPTVQFTDLSDHTVIKWQWDFGDPANPTAGVIQNPKYIYGDTGNFCITLVVENSYHCKDTVIHCLRIEPDFAFYIPNAFSPGASHGLNDEFSGVGLYIGDYEMWIFDRWGNQIFYTNDINKRWDGRVGHSKEIVQEDVYVYLIKVNDLQQNQHVYKGTVSLIK
jgi:PKD repeat protein